jgi:hypothetical protein
MTAKTLAVGLAVVLMMVGGAAAVTAGPAGGTQAPDATNATATAPGEADIEATYDNGTVTATVTQGGEPVENASVEIDEEEYTTDANGSVVAESDGNAYLEVEVETDGFEGEVKYKTANNSLLIYEEEYEYKYDDEHEYEHEAEHESEEEGSEDAAGGDESEDEDEDGEYEDEDEDQEENDDEYDDEQEPEDD